MHNENRNSNALFDTIIEAKVIVGSDATRIDRCVNETRVSDDNVPHVPS